MKRLRIAVDCDDVLVPTAELLVRHYNKTYGTNLVLANFYSTDPELWGVDDYAVAIERIHTYLLTEEYQKTKPFQEAIDAISVLGKHHDLHVVTARSDILAHATTDMLTLYFPELFKTIEFTNFFGKAQRGKAQVCQALGADLLIDDNLHHTESVARCGMDALLFGHYPWNQADITLPNIHRVKNWDEVLERLVR
ncbi:MAG TPA: hypothetical protein VF733_06090 [Candidatus Saccharimonadales bacterium]